MNDDAMLPLGLLLLGVAGLSGFMAFRPWPVDPADTKSPLKPGVYAVEILQGHPPAASNPPDRQGDISKIEGGLAALLALWILAKIAKGIGVGIIPGKKGGGGSGGSGGTGTGGTDTGGGGGVLGEAESIGSDVVSTVETTVPEAVVAG